MPGSEPRRPYLPPLLGIVFDLDGTLVVSHHDFGRMRHEVIRIAERYGVVPGHLTAGEIIPRLMEKARAELESNGVPEGIRFRFEAEVNQAIDAIELEALPRTVARSGALDLLRGMATKGYRVGVLTRSSETFCRQALHQTGLLEFLPTLRTRSAIGPQKPSPESLLLVLEQMQVPVDRAAFVGDHLIDAECGTRARVRFFGLLNEPPDDGVSRERFEAAGASAVLRSLAELGRLLGIPVPPEKVAAAG